MQKRKINITMDQDLIEYAKLYATKQRTTVSGESSPNSF